MLVEPIGLSSAEGDLDIVSNLARFIERGFLIELFNLIEELLEPNLWTKELLELKLPISKRLFITSEWSQSLKSFPFGDSSTLTYALGT